MTSYFNNESLDLLSKEYRTMPTDENGNAYEPEYNGVTVRRDVMRLIFDLRSSMAALEEAQQQLWTAKEERDSQQRVCIKVMEELTEAQQTIARLESELEEMTEDRNIWRSNSADWDAQEELEEEEGETQIQLTDQELNRALAELMGWKVRLKGSCYWLVNPAGEESANPFVRNSEEIAWTWVPDYCNDPAASLEVQAKAMENFSGRAPEYIKNLVNVMGIDFSDRLLYDIAILLDASPRERAEAAYITLQGVKGNG